MKNIKPGLTEWPLSPSEVESASALESAQGNRLAPPSLWQQATAHALEEILYPGLGAVLQRQQELEAELQLLQAEWLRVTQTEAAADDVLAVAGVELAGHAQELIGRLDRLEVQIMAIKSRRCPAPVMRRTLPKVSLFRLAS